MLPVEAVPAAARVAVLAGELASQTPQQDHAVGGVSHSLSAYFRYITGKKPLHYCSKTVILQTQYDAQS